MRALLSRLQALGPAITQICEISGTPGVSVGVLHHGEVIHTAAYGYRDVEAKLLPDEDTIYHVASLSKGMTALGVGILVNEGKLEWDTKIKSLLPQFKHENAQLQEEATIVDFMSHRSGLASQVQFWMQEFGRMSLAQKETLPLMAKIPQVHKFREQFLYCNWGFGLAAILMETLSGMTWGDFLGTRVFAPLGMTRTTTKRNSGLENAAKGYIARSDGSFFQNEVPHVSNGTACSGAAGVQTSVRDLLTLYGNLLRASKDQSERNVTTTEGSPLVELSTILSPHIAVPGYSDGEQAYGLGFTLTDLPGTMGATGINGMFTSDMPVVGRGITEKKRVWHHNGSLAAFLSCIHIVPETDSVIVVLTNSIAKNDAADWLAQMILESLIDSPQKNDYVKIAQESANGLVNEWESMIEQLASDRVANTTSKSLATYVGRYFNDAQNWFMEIFLKDGELYMCMQGAHEESYKLSHYNYNVFSWVLTWDESVERGRFRNPTPDYYLLKFQVQDDEVTALQWTIDGDLPEGQLFKKEAGADKPALQKILNS